MTCYICGDPATRRLTPDLDIHGIPPRLQGVNKTGRFGKPNDLEKPAAQNDEFAKVWGGII